MRACVPYLTFNIAPAASVAETMPLSSRVEIGESQALFLRHIYFPCMYFIMKLSYFHQAEEFRHFHHAARAFHAIYW